MFVDIWWVPLDEGSVRCKVPSYTEQHKHRKDADIRPKSTLDPNPRSPCSSGALDRAATVTGTKTVHEMALTFWHRSFTLKF